MRASPQVLGAITFWIAAANLFASGWYIGVPSSRAVLIWPICLASVLICGLSLWRRRIEGGDRGA